MKEQSNIIKQLLIEELRVLTKMVDHEEYQPYETYYEHVYPEVELRIKAIKVNLIYTFDKILTEEDKIHLSKLINEFVF